MPDVIADAKRRLALIHEKMDQAELVEQNAAIYALALVDSTALNRELIELLERIYGEANMISIWGDTYWAALERIRKMFDKPEK